MYRVKIYRITQTAKDKIQLVKPKINIYKKENSVLKT